MKEGPLSAHPNLIIAGVNKAGTTSLFSYLSAHPDVGHSSIKETCYFLPIRYAEDLAPIDNYHALFNYDNACKYYLEATPGYFYGGIKLLEKIDSTLADVKIILLLREPASRLLSFYHSMKSTLMIDQSMTFDDYVKHCCSLSPQQLSQRENNPYFAVEGGYYSHYLADWITVFGDRLKILFFEEMKSDPEHILCDLSSWLDINANFYVDYKFNIANRTANYRQRWLQQLAISFNRRFEDLFRRYPVLKNRLKHFYAAVNSQPFEATTEQLNIAKEFYVDSNRELAALAKKHNLTRLPQWLRQ